MSQGSNEGMMLFPERPAALKKVIPVGQPYIDSYHRDGFTVLSDIPDEHHALDTMYGFIDRLNPDLIPLGYLKNKMRLATRCQIPNIENYGITKFQALHFDMGHQFVWTEAQPLFLISALYTPLHSEPSEAVTRLVSVEKMKAIGWKFTPQDIESSIEDYVEQYGDGWAATHEFAAHNTRRVACFARLLDACSGKKELLRFYDYKLSEWFQEGIEYEYEFYSQFGVDLRSHIERVNMHPGQMLVMDNIRTIHGREGKRNSRQIWHFTFGLEQSTTEDVAEVRRVVSNAMADWGKI